LFIGDAGAEPEPDAAADSALTDGGYYSARDQLLEVRAPLPDQSRDPAGGNLSKAARWRTSIARRSTG
jgi:hypothetical protein